MDIEPQMTGAPKRPKVKTQMHPREIEMFLVGMGIPHRHMPGTEDVVPIRNRSERRAAGLKGKWAKR